LNLTHFNRQFSNALAVAVHAEETAQELLKQCGPIDLLVVPVETGALITGLAKVLKQSNPSLKVVGVIPVGSALHLGGEKLADSGSYRMEGIGSQYLPQLLDKQLVDTWISVSDKDAFPLARRLISKEGLLVGTQKPLTTKFFVHFFSLRLCPGQEAPRVPY